jgi:hypothetical protein
VSRNEDLRSFYEILDELRERVGGPKFLRTCTGTMRWPARGVYFFFEGGEERSESGVGQRVVRVGTHALTSSSKTSLWDRLSQHRGSAKSGGGNHRGSIFRLLVGEALGRRDGALTASWGIGSGAGDAAKATGLSPESLRLQERPAEQAVSQVIGAMPFLWVEADAPTGAEGLRGLIERNSIALLSNFQREPVDPQSPQWLGRHSARERVKASGLWNNNHVEERYDSTFLGVLARAAEHTAPLR